MTDARSVSSTGSEPRRGLTVIVFSISVTVTLLAGMFAWSELQGLYTALVEGRVRLRFDRTSLAIPGILIGTATLAIMTARHLIAGTISARFRTIGNTLFVVAVVLGFLIVVFGGKWIETELTARGYHQCPRTGRSPIFLDSTLWTIHTAFCAEGAEVERLTIDEMRRQLSPPTQ